MEPSPLTQQVRPEVFKPKIAQLYEKLFRVSEGGAFDEVEKPEDQLLSEGFWREFFLLKPDCSSLVEILDATTPNQLLGSLRGRELFSRAISNLRPGSHAKGNADIHALDTLAIFLSSVLSKKYNSPSSDIIHVLAGLENVDAVFTDFVETLDAIIKTGRSLELRRKALRVAVVVVSGAWSTTLLSYFIQRDLSCGLVALIDASGESPAAVETIILLGMLANYNKFEFQNPYQARLGALVQEDVVKTMSVSIGSACQKVRACYLDVQDDTSEAWTLSNAIGTTLSLIGLGSQATGVVKLAAKKPAPDEEAARKMFSSLPPSEAAILLAIYDLAHLNSTFRDSLVLDTPEGDGKESPFAAYLSATSYLLHHAHLSPRATHYSILNLMVVRLLVEDPTHAQALCSAARPPVRICRHRPPLLPQPKDDSPLACALLNLMVDGMNHNLRRRLDVELYTLCAGILLRIIGHLSRTRTRLQYQWTELWRCLFSIIRFITTYVKDLAGLHQIEMLLDHLVNLVAISLSAGEAFLPAASAYDDLFYKIVESHDTLLKFRDAYALKTRPTNSIDTLIAVGSHYRQILDAGPDKSKPGKLNASDVANVIKEGYETLSIQTNEGLDSWERFREADERVLLRKVARQVVMDVQAMTAS